MQIDLIQGQERTNFYALIWQISTPNHKIIIVHGHVSALQFIISSSDYQ